MLKIRGVVALRMRAMMGWMSWRVGGPGVSFKGGRGDHVGVPLIGKIRYNEGSFFKSFMLS